jgi:hypothetical protein
MTIQDYPFIEKIEQYASADGEQYNLSSDISYWIDMELQKRLLILAEKHPQNEIAIFRTLRTFHHLPVFVFGYREEDKIFLLEAWHYAIRPTSNGETGVQFVLDRVPLTLFQDSTPAADTAQ